MARRRVRARREDLVDPWSEAITRAVAAVSPYVAQVTALNAKEGRAAVGSGCALDHCHVVTHAPLVDPGDEVSVLIGGRKHDASLVARDPLYLIAVLRLARPIEPPQAPDGSPPAAAVPPWSPRDPAVRPGLLCVALGDPFGLERTVTLGVVSAPDRTIYRPERFPVDGLIVTDTAIHPGNIGGPLVSLEGRIVGLNGMPWANGLSLAIQADVVLRLGNQMIDFGAATHPWLGFSGQPEVIDPALATLFDLPARAGVVVNHVAPGGPGERAGIAPFDMVVRVDGEPVPHLGAIRKTLARRRPGDHGRLLILRGGELVELSILVEEIPRLTEA
jgi:serine protease Do